MLIRALLLMLALPAAAQDKPAPATHQVRWKLAAGTKLAVTLTISNKNTRPTNGKITMVWTATKDIDGGGVMAVEVQSAKLTLGAYGVPTTLVYKRGVKPAIKVGKAKSGRVEQEARKNAQKVVAIFETGELSANVGRSSRLRWRTPEGTSMTGGWAGAFFVDQTVHVRLPAKAVTAKATYEGASSFGGKPPTVTVKRVSGKAATLSFKHKGKSWDGALTTTTSTTDFDVAGGFAKSSSISSSWRAKAAAGSKKLKWTWKLKK